MFALVGAAFAGCAVLHIATAESSTAPLSEPGATPAPSRAADGAFTDCPCIDHHTGPGNSSSLALVDRVYAAIEGSQYLHGSTMVIAQTGRSVPRNYGSGSCSMWDVDGESMEDCSLIGGGPQYCTAKWCYVDPLNCHPRRRPQYTLLFPGLPLWYSYLTCGNIDTFKSPSPSFWMSTMAPINVHAFGEAVSRTPGMGSNARRVMTEFTYQLMLELKVPTTALQYLNLSKTSQSMFISSYTACVHDVALGHLDLCVGDFWETTQRRQMKAVFVNTVYSESVHLYTRYAAAEKNVVDYIVQPLRPFTVGLWLLIFGVLFVSGLVMLFFERSAARSEFHHLPRREALAQALYLSFLSMTSATSQFRPVTGEGKVYSLFLVSFIVVLFAVFTGNMASFLLYETTFPEVEDLADALDQGKTVCVLEAMVGMIEGLYPTIRNHALVLESSSQIFPAMENRDCQVGLMTEPHSMAAHSVGDYCEFQRVGEILMSFPTSIFVSERLQPLFAQSVVVARADGTWKAVESKLFPPSSCSDEDFEEATQLTFHNAVGNAGILLLCFCVSVVTRCAHKVERTKPVALIEEQLERAMTEAEHGIEEAVIAKVMEVEEQVEDGAAQIRRVSTKASMSAFAAVRHQSLQADQQGTSENSPLGAKVGQTMSSSSEILNIDEWDTSCEEAVFAKVMEPEEQVEDGAAQIRRVSTKASKPAIAAVRHQSLQADQQAMSENPPLGAKVGQTMSSSSEILNIDEWDTSCEVPPPLVPAEDAPLNEKETIPSVSEAPLNEKEPIPGVSEDRATI